MNHPVSRKDLSAHGLYQVVRTSFESFPDSRQVRKLSLPDVLMSGLAMFSLKYPSLLQFDRCRHAQAVRHNLRTLFGIRQAPCDTYMRERLDEVEPHAFEPVYKRLFARLQRGKGLEGFAGPGGHYVLSVDGTGVFSSRQVRCRCCCEKRHRNGEVTYYHQLLAAVLVHPDCREVIPLMPEAIGKRDGATKNDCERAASKRLLRRVRRNHPHLRLLVVEDALAANGPHIRLLESLDMRFMLGVKPGSHAELFRWVEATTTTGALEVSGEDGVRFRFRFLHAVPLNDAHFDLEVNFLSCQEIRPDGRERRFCWVTDLPIDESNVYELMRVGRARWRIENETFNTLKNQGYGLEHNFGHGNQYLSTVLTHLMMLAFLIDQIQLRCCAVFNRALMSRHSRSALWRKMRALFDEYLISSWESLFHGIAFGYSPPSLPDPP